MDCKGWQLGLSFELSSTLLGVVVILVFLLGLELNILLYDSASTGEKFALL